MENSNNNQRKSLIIVLVLIGLAIVGFVGYKVWKKKQTESGDPIKNNRVIKIIRS